MDRLQRQVERLTELVMAALPTRDSPRPEPVPATTTHPAHDALLLVASLPRASPR
ncbi:hypothetical protein DIPPA_16644 [Diplonema papillatum]|nr:hypothetical protein DIPPA_16644 [Diplonema papillatum]